MSGAQQPGLRSFIVYDELPAGHVAHVLRGGEADPHIMPGEVAVIDPAQREPAERELFLIQFQARRPEEADRHRRIVEARQDFGGWMVAAVAGQAVINLATGRPLEGRDRVRLWDGPYPADYLANMLLGSVVGILKTTFEEPRRAASAAPAARPGRPL
jgi:hypothetical protein